MLDIDRIFSDDPPRAAPPRPARPTPPLPPDRLDVALAAALDSVRTLRDRWRDDQGVQGVLDSVAEVALGHHRNRDPILLDMPDYVASLSARWASPVSQPTLPNRSHCEIISSS